MAFGASLLSAGLPLAEARPGSSIAALVLVAPSIPEDRGPALQKLVDEELAAHVDPEMQATPITRAQLGQSPALAQHRQRARTLLKEATAHVRNVRYPQALTALATAEAAAHEGLASVVEPALLGEIFFQRGFALLAWDPQAAQASWAQSFGWTPDRAVDEDAYAPKILQLLQDAAAEATAAPPPRPTAEQLRPAGDALGVTHLWMGSAWRTDDSETLFLAQVDVKAGRFGWTSRLQWPAHTALAEVAHRLTAALPAAPVADEDASRPRPAKRWLVWSTASAGAGALIAGAVLAGLVEAKESDAEGLAGQDPKAPYDEGVPALEDDAWRYQTAATALFAGGGTALIGAAAMKLVLEEDPTAQRWLTWSAAGVSLAGLASGLTLALMASSQQDEALRLAGAAPLVDYEPRVAELEDARRRYQQAAIATFAVAGAAAAVALASGLWPGPELAEASAEPGPVRWQLSPSGARVTVEF